ncbi:MAG: hypothetical protein HZB33_14250 [Nitrospirae bacterium]|nr:hypothetical protein [Nitrospirota bacterium]
MNNLNAIKFAVLFLTFAVCAVVALLENCPNIILCAALFYFAGRIVSTAALNKNMNTAATREFIDNIYTYGFVLKIIATFIIYYYLMSSRGVSFYALDDEHYELIGGIIGERWMGGDFSIPYNVSNHPGYFVVTGAFHYLAHIWGGYHVLLPRLFNCLFGALIPVYMFKIAFQIYDENIARKSAWVGLLYPQFIIFSALQMRDIIITTIFLIGVHYFIRYRTDSRYRVLIVPLGLIIVLSYFRYFQSVVLAIIGIMTVMLPLNRVRAKKMILRSALLLLMVLVGIAIFNIDIYKVINPKETTIEQQADRGEEHSFRQFRPTVQSSSLASRLYAAVPSVLRPVVFPFLLLIQPYPPWIALVYEHSLGWLEFLNGIYWYLLLPFCITGIFFAVKEKTLLSFPVYVTLLSILFISSTSFFAERYRLPGMPFALILSAAGIVRTAYLSWAKFFYVEIHLLLLSGYFIAKYNLFSLPALTVLILAFISVFIAGNRKSWIL